MLKSYNALNNCSYSVWLRFELEIKIRKLHATFASPVTAPQRCLNKATDVLKVDIFPSNAHKIFILREQVLILYALDNYLVPPR